MLKTIWTSQGLFGLKSCGLMKLKLSYLDIRWGGTQGRKRTQQSKRNKHLVVVPAVESVTKLKLQCSWIF